jgi:hypothetical protein
VVRAEQIVERAAADARRDRRRVIGERVVERLRHGAMLVGVIVLPAHGQAGVAEQFPYLLQRRQPHRVGVWHRVALPVAERRAGLEREGEPSAHCQRASDLPDQRPLVREGEHRLEQQNDVERARRKRRHPCHLEAAVQPVCAGARDVDRARAGVDSQVAAAERARDEASGSRHAAADVQHRDARRDAGPLREIADLAGAHEALLLHVLARRVRALAGAPQRLHEAVALVLLHG